MAQGSICEHFEAPWELLGAVDQLWDGLSFNLRSAGVGFSQIYWKSEICVFRRHSHTESLLLQVPAPKLEPLGQKSGVRPVQNALTEGSRLKFGRSVQSSCESYGNFRKPGENHIKAKAKVYIADKT